MQLKVRNGAKILHRCEDIMYFIQVKEDNLPKNNESESHTITSLVVFFYLKIELEEMKNSISIPL